MYEFSAKKIQKTWMFLGENADARNVKIFEKIRYKNINTL